MPGFVTGGYLNEDRYGEQLTDVLVHVTDWYPTLLSAAGIEVNHITSKRLHNKHDDENDEVGDDVRFDKNGVGNIDIDGKDIWNAIQFGDITDDISIDNREILLDLNSKWCEFSSCGAIRIGKYKFMRGNNIGTNQEHEDGDTWQRVFSTCVTNREYDGILGLCKNEFTTNALGCHLEENGCLFDIDTDPCEYNNLADEYPDIVAKMVHRLDFYEKKATTPLITLDNQLDYHAYMPSLVCENNEKFWCPFQDYALAEFEETLTEQYKTLYPSEDDDDEEEEEKKVSSSSIMNIGNRMLLFVLSILVIMSICFVISINIQHGNNNNNNNGFSSKMWMNYNYYSTATTALNNLRDETSPLVK